MLFVYLSIQKVWTVSTDFQVPATAVEMKPFVTRIQCVVRFPPLGDDYHCVWIAQTTKLKQYNAKPRRQFLHTRNKQHVLTSMCFASLSCKHSTTRICWRAPCSNWSISPAGLLLLLQWAYAGTDRRTDGRTPYRYIDTVCIARGQCQCAVWACEQIRYVSLALQK